MIDKKALRREIGAKKRAMTDEQIETLSARLCDAFLASEAYRAARSVYVYLPYNQEVRTWRIVEAALRDGKRVAVPKVYDEHMRFLWLDDVSRLAPGAYGIPEPVYDEPEADDDEALILMPGLAFDAEGHRLGYGGGFYDRYLETHPKHTLVALCYPFQLLEHLETEAHDIPVHSVISC